MITEKGKAILGKYMTTQNDSTFSYIALGVGAVPAYDPVAGSVIGGWEHDESDGNWEYTFFNISSNLGQQKVITEGFVPEYNKLNIKTDADIKYSDMKELDFEVIRVPITESGVEYVKSEGNNKYFTDIVLTATVPSFDRYKFTEVGVYSAQSNAIATTKSSQLLFKFAPEENWAGVSTTTKSNDDNVDLGVASYYPYDNANFKYFQDNPTPGGSPLPQLYTETRVGSWSVTLNNTISNDVSSFGFGALRPDDEFRLAYFLNPTVSLTGKTVANSATITFTDRAGKTASGNFTTNNKIFAGDTSYSIIPTNANFGQTYAVGVIAVKDLTVGTGFSWADVRTVSLVKQSEDAPDILVDALRFVSTNYNNPNYGLLAYSIVQNRNGSTPDDLSVSNVEFSNFVIPEPVVKQKGLETLIQYRIRISESLNGEDYVAF